MPHGARYMALHRRVFVKRKCGPEGGAGSPSTAVWRALRPIPLASGKPLPLFSAQATPQAQGRGWPCHVTATFTRPFGGPRKGGLRRHVAAGVDVQQRDPTALGASH